MSPYQVVLIFFTSFGIAPPKLFHSLRFCNWRDDNLHVLCAILCQPFPTEISPCCYSLFQLTDCLLQGWGFFFINFLSVQFLLFLHHLIFLHKSVLFYLPYFSFLLSQIFWRITLFLFQNFINPVFIGLYSALRSFPDANPYIWSHLSVIAMHKEDYTLINALDCNKTPEQHLPGCEQIQVTFWKLHENLLLSTVDSFLALSFTFPPAKSRK